MLVLVVLTAPRGPAASVQQPDRRATGLFERLLGVDTAVSGQDDRSEAARERFARANARGAACSDLAPDGPRYVACVFSALRETGDFQAIQEPSGLAVSTVSELFVRGRGNCAAIAGGVLALDARLGRLEAVVLPSHVLLTIRGDETQYFEPLESGRVWTGDAARARFGAELRRAPRAHGKIFFAYYADNLAVRSAGVLSRGTTERLFRRAVGAAPRAARIRFNFGTWLLEQGRLNDARSQLRKAVKLDPEDAAAWINRGIVLDRLGDQDAAARCFRRALGIDPGSRIALDNLRALEERGESPAD